MPDPLLQKIHLSNEGYLGLTFIGTGSAFSKKFYQTNLLVVKGEDHLLIDCGSRGPEALAALGLSVTQIRNFLITHNHADHIGGLEEVMLTNRYVAKQKATIVITPEYQKSLWCDSLKGGAYANERSRGRYLGFSDFWNVLRPTRDPRDRRLYEARVGGLSVRLFRTKHIPDSARSWRDSALSYGVVLDDRILFSSDTRFDPDLVIGLDERFHFEAIFHDCQFYSGGVHASLDELSGLPDALKAKTTLVHYGDSVDAQRDKARDYGFAGFAEQWKEYRFR